MDGGFNTGVDDRRSKKRPTTSSATGGPTFSFGRTGCSLLSLAAVAVIVALAATGMLEQSVSLIRSALGGRKADVEFVMRNNCRQLLAALKVYAGDHGESYPDTLYELAPDPLSEQELDRLVTEGTGNDISASAAWILTPKLTTSSAGSEILILSTRPVARNHHIAGLNDGSVTTVSIETAAEHLSRHRL